MLSLLISVSPVDIHTETPVSLNMGRYPKRRGKTSGGTVTTTAWIFMSTSQSWPGDSPKTIIVFNIQYKTRPVIVFRRITHTNLIPHWQWKMERFGIRNSLVNLLKIALPITCQWLTDNELIKLFMLYNQNCSIGMEKNDPK